MYFGIFIVYEKECFIYVFKGYIVVSVVVFLIGIKGYFFDFFVCLVLWDLGLDYLYGIGYGVGFFLNVYEGFCGISYKIFFDEFLEVGMIVIDEFGYYEDGVFGICIENVVFVVFVKIKYNFNNWGSLIFEFLILVLI